MYFIENRKIYRGESCDWKSREYVIGFRDFTITTGDNCKIVLRVETNYINIADAETSFQN